MFTQKYIFLENLYGNMRVDLLQFYAKLYEKKITLYSVTLWKLEMSHILDPNMPNIYIESP